MSFILEPDRRNPLPLYYRLKELLREQIEDGRLKPDDRLPSERELSQKYGLSRMTVRQALAELANEGNLYRVQGKGSFVSRPKIDQGLSGLTGFTEDMLKRGMIPGARVLRIQEVPASRKVAGLLDLNINRRVILIERLRLANNQPMALETVHLPATRFPGLSDEDLESNSLYRILEQKHSLKLGRARQSIEAGQATAGQAEILKVKEGAILLRLERVTFDSAGEPVEFVQALYRGDRYKFFVELSR